MTTTDRYRGQRASESEPYAYVGYRIETKVKYGFELKPGMHLIGCEGGLRGRVTLLTIADVKHYWTGKGRNYRRVARITFEDGTKQTIADTASVETLRGLREDDES